MHSSATLLLHLPAELLLSILNYVHVGEWKRIRLTCKSLSTLAASLLFQRVSFELCGTGCNPLYSISQNYALNGFVQTMVLRRVRGYRKFADSDTWAESMHQPGAPDVFPFTADKTTYYNNKELRDQLLPYAKWAQMSREEKEVLYQEYNADRLQEKQNVEDITDTLCFRGLASGGPKFIHPNRALATGNANVAARQLYKALTTLPNLIAFEHEPGYIYDDNWALRWRDLYLHPHSIVGQTDDEEDQDVEALQLSVVLQAFACVRGAGRRLQKMSMCVGGPAFATPERLALLWSGSGHELVRTCRRLHPSSEEADADACIGFVEPAEIELYDRQLKLMAHAFADLTSLDCRVSDDDLVAGCIETVAKFVFPFLMAANRLQTLCLAVGQLAGGQLLPVWGRAEREQAEGSMRLLWNLALHSRWSRIRNIELEIATDRNMLMKFLLAHKDTLRSLTLIRTSLVRLGNHQNTWEPTLTEIGRCLRLESLRLSTLCDTLQVSEPGVRERMLFDVEDDVWQGNASGFEAYHDRIVARVLRGEVIDSLQPQAAETGQQRPNTSAVAAAHSH